MGTLYRVARSIVQQVKDGFHSLQDSPRDLYLTYALMVLESFNYFSSSLLFVLYLTQEFGVSDIEAGTLYGLWGTLLVVYGIAFSSVIDLFGFRGSLIICYILNIGGRFVVATTTSKAVLLWTLLGPVTVAGALGTPVQTIAIKRYTTETNRGFAFSLFYSLMNVAALMCASVLDTFRVTLKHGFAIQRLPSTHFLNDGNRLLLFMGCLTSTAALLISCFLRERVQLVDSQQAASKQAGSAAELAEEGAADKASKTPLLLEDAEGKDDAAGEGGSTRGSKSSEGGAAEVDAVQPVSWASFWTDAKEVLMSVETWKFMAMCVITVNLKQIFRHVDATLPKYLLRAYGCDAPVGLVYGINPFMIIFLVPLVGALTTKRAHFDMIHYGSYLSALSPFWIVAFPGHEWGAVLFVVTLSLGESVWSPRWYDYSMSLAPEGREGIFTALASAPLFAAKLPTGMLSGALLQRYCPDSGACDRETGAQAGALGACDGRALWGVIGALTLTSPLLILLTQRWVRPKPRAAAAARGGEGGGSLSAASSAQALAGEGDGGGLAPLAREGSVGPGVINTHIPGVVNTHIAVPVHDFLEEEAPADAALLARQQGHGHRRRAR